MQLDLHGAWSKLLHLNHILLMTCSNISDAMQANVLLSGIAGAIFDTLG
jgi:hypothetical protein